MAGANLDPVVDELKRRTSLVQLIGEFVALKKAGRSHKGLCPFHGEKSPSFHVSDGDGFYYCFGCQAKGDAISFLKEHLGLSFREALENLSERTGVPLPDPRESAGGTSRAPRLARSDRERLTALNAAALQFYRSQLGSEAAAYLMEKRGLTPDTIDRYQLGWAADAWDSLARTLLRSPSTQRDALALGLVAQRRESAGGSEPTGVYDKFRGRVMFPVFTVAGQVAGFSARTLSTDPETPKYLNSGESELFKKGELLYGLYQARQAIRTKGRAVVVEGNVDVLSLAQAGFEETVAPMGTALTEAQAQLLGRFTRTVVLVYDGDRAGRAATLKAIPIVLRAGLDGRAVTLPLGEDPDTFVQGRGAEAFAQLLESARPLLDVAIDAALDGFDGTIPAKARIAEELAPLFATLAQREARELYTRRLAMALGVLESDLTQWLRRAGPAPTPAAPPRAEPQLTPVPRTERELMGVVLRNAAALLPHYVARDAQSSLTHAGVRSVLSAAVEVTETLGRFDVGALFELLGERGLEAAQAAVAKVLSAVAVDVDPERAFVELVDHLEALARRRDADRRRAEIGRLSVEEQLRAVQREVMGGFA